MNNMKKLLALFFALLFLLSSCGYTAKDIDEIETKWSSEYFELEEKYYKSANRVDVLESLLSRIDEKYATLYCYYDDHDPDITEKEALDALSEIGELLRDAGY